jgi:hypothetical protein
MVTRRASSRLQWLRRPKGLKVDRRGRSKGKAAAGGGAAGRYLLRLCAAARARTPGAIACTLARWVTIAVAERTSAVTGVSVLGC